MSEACGCPGSRMAQFERKADTAEEGGKRGSQLAQWPVQLHLVSPQAPYFQGADLLLSADCVAHAVGDYHKDYLKGKSLAIACPKLDDGLDAYVEKLAAMIDEAQINSITLMIMQVPCCRGLLSTLQQARQRAKRQVPVKLLVVSLQGEILTEDWV